MNPEKLTSYALNELPPAECAALEAQMKTNPALRQQAEDVAVFCRMLREEVTAEAEDTLQPGQRARLLQEFQRGSKVIRPLWRRPSFISGLSLAAAACVALMLSIHGTKEAAPGKDQVFRVKTKSPAPEPTAPRAAIAEAAQDKGSLNSLGRMIPSDNHPMPGAVLRSSAPALELPKPATPAVGGARAKQEKSVLAINTPMPAPVVDTLSVATASAASELPPFGNPVPAAAAPVPLKAMKASSDAPVAAAAPTTRAQPRPVMQFGDLSMSASDIMQTPEDHTVTFTRDVQVQQPAFTLVADKVAVRSEGQDAGVHFEASGAKVIVKLRATANNPEATASAGSVEYDAAAGKFILRDLPEITRGTSRVSTSDKSAYFVISKDGTLRIHGQSHTEVLPNHSK